MSELSGNDDRSQRSDAAIISCEAWMAQGAYIILPLNPEEISFDLGVRTSNELARAANIIYVWRYLGNSSMLVKPTISMRFNSGYIVPSFDPSYVLEANTLVNDKVHAMRNTRNSGQAGSQEQQSDLVNPYASLEADIAISRAFYDDRLKEYSGRLPMPEQTKDYIKGTLYEKVGESIRPNPMLTDSGNAEKGSGNMPDLYSYANRHVPIGIQNLYALFSLADERRIRKTSERGGQTENRVMLILSTLAFPRLVLYGWFGESGISYTESAEDPHSFDVSFDLVVTETNPPLSYGNWDQLIRNYRDGMYEDQTTLDYAKAQWPSGTPAQTPRNG
jgi:hypothetical protein